MSQDSHMTRREYRKKYAGEQQEVPNRSAENKLSEQDTASTTRTEYRHLKLNFWEIFSDRPYVAVAIVVNRPGCISALY